VKFPSKNKKNNRIDQRKEPENTIRIQCGSQIVISTNSRKHRDNTVVGKIEV